MTKYWRVTPKSDAERSLQGAGDFRGDIKFINSLRIGDGIIMADWDRNSRTGIARAIGIVLAINAPDGSATMEWRQCRETFYPNPQGGIPQWTKPQGWFGFDKPVAQRYRLPQIFQRAFPDLDGLSYGSTIKLDAETRGLSSNPKPGYIYIIKSDHGSKIGRSVHIRSRTQLLKIKFPFESEVVYLGYVNDYVVAERHLHRKYAGKHIRGEWYDLSDDDIDEIATSHDSVTVPVGSDTKGVSV